MTIEVKQLSFNHGSQPALVDIDFSLNKSEILVVYGPSGSGKSTLLRLIAGLERPATGEIILSGKTVSSEQIMLPPYNRQCAMIFQQLALWPHMTVNEHLEFVLCPGEKKSGRLKIAEMLRQLELTGKEGCYPAQLSGGEQQRLAIGRALMPSPGFILFDEPLSNLDNLLQEKIIALLHLLKRKKSNTMIYVTHNLAEVMQLADTILVLKEGRQTFCGSKKAFIAKFQSSIQQSVSWYTQSEERDEK